MHNYKSKCYFNGDALYVFVRIDFSTTADFVLRSGDGSIGNISFPNGYRFNTTGGNYINMYTCKTGGIVKAPNTEMGFDSTRVNWKLDGSTSATIKIQNSSVASFLTASNSYTMELVNIFYWHTFD